MCYIDCILIITHPQQIEKRHGADRKTAQEVTTKVLVKTDELLAGEWEWRHHFSRNLGLVCV